MSGRASSPVKKVFGAPYMGVVNALPEHEVSPNALWSAFNCVFANGQVITRPSMVRLSVVTGGAASLITPDTRLLGCFSTTTSAGNYDIYTNSHTNFYRLRNLTGSWTDISGTVTLTNTDVHTPRYSSIYNQATGQIATFMVNGVDDNTVSLDGGNFSIPVVAGRKGTDVCTAASRLVAIEPPYNVWWSDIYSYGFPALNFYTAHDTPGKVVAIRNLGTLGVCIYKEDSIVVGYSQPGSPANAFRFETRVELPGPAGASAVVQAEGRHFIMTSRGRIGMFDGTRFDWVGDGVWNYMLFDFDYNYRSQTHGFYDETYGQVWFVYPRVADEGVGPTGIVVVSLPRPAWGVPTYGIWPGAFAMPASCSTTLRLTSGTLGLVMRADTGLDEAELITDPIAYDSNGDDEVDFNCHLQTGLQPMGDVSKIEIEPFVRRAADHGEAVLSPVTSYALATDGGTVGSGQTIDLEDTTIIHGVRGYNVSGRFAGLRLDWQSRYPEAEIGAEEGGFVVYKGAAIYGYGVENP